MMSDVQVKLLLLLLLLLFLLLLLLLLLLMRDSANSALLNLSQLFSCTSLPSNFPVIFTTDFLLKMSTMQVSVDGRLYACDPR